MSMTELYWIATNPKLSLTMRYEATRMMQAARVPEPPKRQVRPYSRDAERIILRSADTTAICNALDRSKRAIWSKRYQLKRKEKLNERQKQH